MEDISEAGCGDIAALFGIDCASGDTFCGGKVNYAMTSMFVPNPVISLAIFPKDKKSQDNMSNSTRFFEVRRTGGPIVQPAQKTLVVCRIDGQRAGSLCAVLEEFAFRGINMTRIESRPARTELGEYMFFFDLDMDAPRAKLEESIEAVRGRSTWLRRLGSFPVIRARTE